MKSGQTCPINPVVILKNQEGKVAPKADKFPDIQGLHKAIFQNQDVFVRRNSRYCI